MQQQLIRTKCAEVFAKAKVLWPHLDFANVAVRFDLKGRAAGMACRRGRHYFMRFNADMLEREAFDHIINDTVPHEIAHLVCFMDPSLGRNHDYGWATVCRKLGGSGARCHKEEVVYGKGSTYEYTTDKGHTYRVSETIHKKIQLGREYTLRGGKGKITKTCAHSIVGHQGRTLANPIVKKPVAPNAPVAIETALRSTPPVQKPRKDVVFDPAAIAAAILAAKTKAPVVVTPTQRALPGESKAATSRRIMLAGYQAGHTYEQIITAMIAANGYERQLARATFKANAARVNIPATFC